MKEAKKIIKTEKSKKGKHKNRFSFSSFFILIFLFCLSLGIGILVARSLIEKLGAEQLEGQHISFGNFVLNFVFAIVFIGIVFLIGRKFQKGKNRVFKALFLLSVSSGALVTLGVFMGDVSVLAVIGLIVLWLKTKNILIHNFLVILGIVGAGSFLGTRIAPRTVVLLLILFSIYDYIAVYKTKHMVGMAKEMIKQGAILGLILPQSSYDFSAPMGEVKPGSERFFVLGGGDIVFPLVFCVSVLPSGLMNALIIALFSCLGLLTNLYFFSSQKKKKPIPALPLIALFSIIGFFLTGFLVK